MSNNSFHVINYVVILRLIKRWVCDMQYGYLYVCWNKIINYYHRASLWLRSMSTNIYVQSDSIVESNSTLNISSKIKQNNYELLTVAQRWPVHVFIYPGYPTVYVYFGAEILAFNITYDRIKWFLLSVDFKQHSCIYLVFSDWPIMSCARLNYVVRTTK